MPRASSRSRPRFALAALPDEHAYSVLARYHRLAAHPTPELTASHVGLSQGPLKAQDIFNAPARSALPAIAGLLGMPARTFAERHTLWPFFRAAMAPETAAAWAGRLAAGDVPGPGVAEPLNDRLLHHDRRWRHCPECAREDRAQFGIAYWHVSHQLPALGSCPRHRCRLIGACPTCDASRMNLRGLELPASLCECASKTEPMLNPRWDRWLHNRFEGLRGGHADTLDVTLREIRDALSLPARITAKHRHRLDRLLGDVEEVVGEELLGEVFEWYRTSGRRFRQRRKPNLIRAALTEEVPWRVRHPLYYLVIAYAAHLGVGAGGAE